MSLPLLMITNLDNMSEKEQKEFMKNISEGMNENIFFDPNKNNLVKFKKSFINKLRKQAKTTVEHIMAALILDTVKRIDDEYWYFDCHCEKYANNNYYECFRFTEKHLHDYPDLPKLIEMKNQANQNNKENIVCFHNNGKLSVCEKPM